MNTRKPQLNLAIFALLLIFPTNLQAFTVDSTGDDRDLNIGDGVCCTGSPLDTNGECNPPPPPVDDVEEPPASTGTYRCTLRAAIQEANANSDLSYINFGILGNTPRILLTSTLPYIRYPVILNGNTGGAERVELDGRNLAGSPTGIDLRYHGGSEIRALVLHHFYYGIRAKGSGQHLLHHNWIGTTRYGTSIYASKRQAYGIWMDSPQNRIENNLISGNQHGVYLYRGDENKIQDNLIGTNRHGQSIHPAGGNSVHGIHLGNVNGTLIGGNHPSQQNLISGNLNAGIYLSPQSQQSQIQGNRIGTNLSGENPLGNGVGIWVEDSADNLIGGIENNTGNLIAGNQNYPDNPPEAAGHGIYLSGINATNNLIQGNFIGTDHLAEQALANEGDGIHFTNTSHNQIGGLELQSKNLISGNQRHGIFFNESHHTLIANNYVGANLEGTQSLSNQKDGIHLHNSSENEIGGLDSTSRNLISGNLHNGIQILRSSEDFSSTRNHITGNFIGTDHSGTQRLANGENGILINKATGLSQGPTQTTIGGLRDQSACDQACNVISGNGKNGIHIQGSGSSSHTIQGNFIGTDFTGSVALANQQHGIALSGARNNVIGGFTPEPKAGPEPEIESETNSPATFANLISGNQASGLQIEGTLANENQALGNYVGTDFSGTQAVGNQVGISLYFTTHNNIGGLLAGAGNLISGNFAAGVIISESHSNILRGNFIGVDTNHESPLPNQSHGILLTKLSTGNTIGGLESNAGNLISHNLGAGIYLDSQSNNAFYSNFIFDNQGLGIDLSPVDVNFNDALDADLGANFSQNFPVITAAVPQSGPSQSKQIMLEGYLNAQANQDYLLEFFANESCHNSQHGEGQYPLGFGLLSTNDEGRGEFALSLNLKTGSFITATATNDSQNTSEFSACFKTGPKPPPPPPPLPPDFDEDEIPDTEDNCLKAQNPEQTDDDGDGIGNACDVCPLEDDKIDENENEIPDCLEKVLHGGSLEIPLVSGGCSLVKE